MTIIVKAWNAYMRLIDRMLAPLNEPLLRFMEATGLIRPIEAIVKWLAARFPEDRTDD